MKIKMRTLQAGPDIVREPGHIYEVPTAEAKALIAGGYAEEVTRQIPVERATRVTTTRRGRLVEDASIGGEEEAEEGDEKK
jgi:hypothetical protein